VDHLTSADRGEEKKEPQTDDEHGPSAPVPAPAAAAAAPAYDEEDMREAKEFKNAVQGGDKGDASDDSDDDIGPQPLPQATAAQLVPLPPHPRHTAEPSCRAKARPLLSTSNRTCAFLVVVRSDIPKMTFNPMSSRDML